MKKKTTKNGKSMEPPKVSEVCIRLLHERKQVRDGYWRFVPALPNEGESGGLGIIAKTPEEARDLLERWLIDEFNWNDDDIECDD